MKLAFSLLLLAPTVFAETVEVYREVDVDHKSVRGIKIEKDDPATWPQTFGAKLGVNDTGDKKFPEIIKDYAQQSWNGEPFYGRCETYVFKDSQGAFSTACFEFEKGHKTFQEGKRFAVTMLEPVKGSKERIYRLALPTIF